MKSFSTIVLLLVIFQASAQNYARTTSKATMRIVQGENSFPISGQMSKIKLKKAPFMLIFKNYPYLSIEDEFYATSIVASTEPYFLSDLKEGKNKDETSHFSSGMGVAGPYGEHLYVDFDNSNQYLFYDPDAEQRVNLIKKERGGLMEFSWHISYFDRGSSVDKVINSEINTLYIGIFSDLNLNEIIDKGEFGKIEVRFK